MESRTFKCDGERNDHVFGNVFERRESRCCGVLMKYHCKVKGEQVNTPQMTQYLKTKNINIIPGQIFCCQYKAKFLLETKIDCINDDNKIQKELHNHILSCIQSKKSSN